MSVPEHLWRFPTREAIDNLALRFDLPNTPDMQDWEWEVADPERIDEFVTAYQSGGLTDDERFTLMETIIQSFEDLGDSLVGNPRWTKVLGILEASIELHIYSIWYWSDLENENEQDSWRVTPFLRTILGGHRERFEKSGGTRPPW